MSGPGGAGDSGGPSGLRDPEGAVRAAGLVALLTEGLVLAMSIVPLRTVGGGLASGGLLLVLGLVVVAVGLAVLLRHRWAWYAGTAFQVVLLVAGLVHVALAVIGVIFGLAWASVLYLRHRVLGRVF